MQLSKIKISGFKSFVDPTTITLPSNLIAIVGPNGCGKSNIIDAVTWVMGESSPKYLRGESLTDVIFNGSTSRKPVGQAAVELVFDNADGTIGGEYANYGEIAIKRMINRDSDSTYYLNGVRCRKRDIVDIFLGTGLGPRSYSIIGQNMISRVIEAKPDDLRTYLEEAAGISKYKDRRHETELRINHTKENLARVNDLVGELDKQLAHLKQQANAAEKYKSLKQQERVLRAELYGIQWRTLDSKLVDYTLKIQHEETGLESRNSELTGTDREIEQMRHEQRVAHDAFQEVQRRYYSIGNEITRIEQDILHHKERKQQWENDLQQTEADWSQIKTQMVEAEDNLQELEHDILTVEPQIALAEKEETTVKNDLSKAEETTQYWQQSWDEFTQVSAKTSEIAQVEQTHIQHLEQRIIALKKRQEQLQANQGQFNFSDLNQELEAFTSKSDELGESLEFLHQQIDEVKKEINTLQSAQQNSNTNLDNVRSELQRLLGQQASLEALQQTALGQRDNPAAPWVEQHQLDTKPRLAQNIDVEKGWELAVEKVLGYCLQAICVEDINALTNNLKDFKSGNLCIISQTDKAAITPADKQKGRLLLQKVKSTYPLESLLTGIYVADTLDDALELCASLEPHESVVTRDGIWLNRSWLKILRQEDAAAGVFERELELKQLTSKIANLKRTQEDLEHSIERRNEDIKKLESKRDELLASQVQQQTQAAEINAQHKLKQERLAELKTQCDRVINEQSECNEELKRLQTELIQARSLWQNALEELEKHGRSREELIKDRDKVRQNLQTLRENWDQKKDKLHELQIRVQTTRSQKSAIQQNMVRLQTQLTSLNERKVSLQSELSSIPPMDTLQKSLTRALDKHVSVETELNTARVLVESLDQEFRNLEHKRQTIEREINKVRTTLEGLRVDWQGWKVKADTLREQIKETQFTLEDVLKELPHEITAEEWQTKLDQVVQRISRLGAINLVAIDEYATCQERKQYLDKQVQDLQSGLQTLEDAIAKIDRETRAKFKETFDEVNQKFQELFPTIFGGGKAYLELTNENLLEAGVTVMACPPGKRNSSIYLLSGGEKSLTAIALIFSIFYLNPAPFCLLDEVDAALDDANVLRFTRLLLTMANKTQFIFISHNKITIEMAEHLIGVTMNEPGVSRLVSVDIEKAISMTEPEAKAGT